jgi:hypothetical protein
MALLIVPSFVVDALESAATRDAVCHQAWLAYVRWQAHTVQNAGLLASPADLIDRARAQLAQAARMLSGDDLQPPDEPDGLVSIVAGGTAREAMRQEGRDTRPVT